MNTTTGAPTADQASQQNLATGSLATAFLHVERAIAGREDWQRAHAHIQRVTSGPIDSGVHTSLFHGLPAVAFLLHAASADGSPRYQPAATVLDTHLRGMAQRRLAAATTRIDAGADASFAEYDLFSGLAGITALLLRRAPATDTVANLLDYLVRLIRPRRRDDLWVPGWWVDHDPDPTLPTPGGHANCGMAHGAAGLLAVLALASRHGQVVDGQSAAIADLTDWFDRWRQSGPDGPWWPQWLTAHELRIGRTNQATPGRPSWCYGSVGILRALHLAALATADQHRRLATEAHLAAVLTDTGLRLIADSGVCHGIAGIYLTAHRAAADARTSTISQRLPALAARMDSLRDTTGGTGLLTGMVGVDLTRESLIPPSWPHSGWDACLLIT